MYRKIFLLIVSVIFYLWLDVKYAINSIDTNNTYSFLNDNPEYYFDNIRLSYKGRVAFTNILLDYIDCFVIYNYFRRF